MVQTSEKKLSVNLVRFLGVKMTCLKISNGIVCFGNKAIRVRLLDGSYVLYGWHTLTLDQYSTKIKITQEKLKNGGKMNF